MTSSFRMVTMDDLALAESILGSAYRSERDWRGELGRYLRIQPDAWWLVLRDGVAVGIGGATDYEAFAHIGLVGVLPEVQGQGIGRALMKALIERLEQRGRATFTLDASEAGAPLYERMDFVDEGRTRLLVGERIAKGAVPEGIAALHPEALDQVVVLDAPIFGAPRRAVLAAYLAEFPERAVIATGPRGEVEGFLFAQHSAIGPWAAASPAAAERLLLAALALDYRAPPRVLAPDANTDVMPLLQRHGFELRGVWRHMRYGPPIRRDRTRLYAEASMAIG